MLYVVTVLSSSQLDRLTVSPSSLSGVSAGLVYYLVCPKNPHPMFQDHFLASSPSSSPSASIKNPHSNPFPQLVIPKHHGAKLTDIPDDALTEILPVVKKLAAASGAVDYNVLQNNGRIAHQEVDHVHFHMIPKPNETEGLGVGWPAGKTDFDALKLLHAELKAKF